MTLEGRYKAKIELKFHLCKEYLIRNTGNDGYNGDRYSGNDGYSGLNPPDDAILFTVSGITAIADKKLIKYRRF